MADTQSDWENFSYLIILLMEEDWISEYVIISTFDIIIQMVLSLATW